MKDKLKYLQDATVLIKNIIIFTYTYILYLNKVFFRGRTGGQPTNTVF